MAKLQSLRLMLIPALLSSAVLTAPVRAATSFAAGPQSLRQAPQAGPGATFGATLNDTLLVDADGDGAADPGDKVRYTAIITNQGVVDAPSFVFSATTDSNTTLSGSYQSTPLAVNDAYSATGNISISVPSGAGVLGNDYRGVSSATIVSYTATSARGGAVALNGDGSFTYNPPTGYRGADIFTYTLSNALGSDLGQVTINVAAPVWFINNAPGACIASCDGSLARPFTTIAAFNTVNNGGANRPAAGDTVFVYSGNYASALTLLSRQKLIGQGASASLPAAAGITVPAYSAALPSTGGVRPMLTGSTSTLVLSQNNIVRGLDINNTGGTALSGTGFGTFTTTEVSVANSNCSQAIFLWNGALNAQFDRVDANACTNGIYLDTTSGAFTVVGDGGSARNTSGGVIKNSTADGVRLIGASNVVLRHMQLESNRGSGVLGNSVNGFVLEHSSVYTSGVSGDGAGLRFTNLSGSTQAGANPVRISNSILSGSTNHNVDIANTSGTLGDLAIISSTIAGAGENGFVLEAKTVAVAAVHVYTTSFIQNTGAGFFGTALAGGGLTVGVTGSTFDGNFDGVICINQFTGVAACNISNNTFDRHDDVSIFVGSGPYTSGGGSVAATVLTNTVHVPSTSANHGIFGALSGGSGSQASLQIAGNTVTNNGSGRGIFVDTPDTGSASSNAVFITGNSVTGNVNALDAIGLSGHQSATTVCAKIDGNTASATPAGSYGVNLAQASGATVKLEGTGAAGAALSANNPAAGSTNVTGTVTVVASGVCGEPPVIASLTPLDYAQARLAAGQTAAAAGAGSGKVLAALNRTASQFGSASLINVPINTFPAGKHVTIVFDVIIDNPVPDGLTNISAQGVVQSGVTADVLTDDPATVASKDATLTALDIKADLQISKSASSNSVLPGDRLTYTLRYTNAGPQTALGVVITDVLPLTLTGVSYTSSPAIVSTGGFTYVWPVGVLAPDATGLITVTGIVSNVRAGALSNAASIAGSLADTNTLNNTSAVTVSILNAAPAAIADGATTAEETPVTASVLANDTDLNRDALSLSSAGTPANGQASVIGGAIRYTPTLNFNGVDQLTYVVSDGALTATGNLSITVTPVNDAPTVTVRASQTVFVGDSVTLDGSDSGDVDGPTPLQYTWAQTGGTAVSFNDSLSVTQFTAPSAPSVLTFTVWVTDGTGLSGTLASTTVIVTDVLPLSPAASNDGPTQLGAATHFSVTTQGGSNLSYTWSFGDGGTGSGATPSHTYASIGGYTATVTATNGSGVAVAQTSVSVVDLPAGGLSASNSSPNTAGQATQFTATVSGGTGLSYGWDFGDGGSGAGANPAHTYAGAGVYTATVTVSNTSGTQTATTQVNIWPVPSVSLSRASYSVDESDGPVLVTVTLDTPSSLPVTVSLASTDGSAGAPADYLTLSRAVRFEPGTTSQSIAISITDDALHEVTETFSLALSAPTNAVLGGTSIASVTIADDDAAPSVQFAQPVYSADESAGTALVTVTLSGPSAITATVAYSTVDGVAAAPGDYAAAAGVLTFAPGELTRTFTVTVNDDAVYEADETFALRLANPAGASLGGVSSATFTIVNDDAPAAAQLDSAAVSVAEAGGTVVFTITLDAPSAITATLNYATVAGGATSADYTPANGTLTFAPGVLTRTLAVSITDDVLHETDETFQLRIGAPVNAALGPITQTDITILDDDAAPGLQFDASSYAASEGAGPLVVTVTLDAPSAITATVAYTTIAGSASKADYTSTAGVLTFAPGVLTQTIGVPVIDDLLHETDETFQVRLETPVNASLGSITETEATILDNDFPPPVQFDARSYSVAESARGVVVTVTLVVPSAITATVDYATAPGSASFADYQPVSGTLIFAPGSQTQTFSVPVINDAVHEADETFQVQLGALSGAIYGPEANATVTILDDDPAPVAQLASSSETIAEGAGTLTLTVSLDAASDVTATVGYSAIPSSATAADYSPAGGVLTFAPGVLTQTIEMSITGDLLHETDETFQVRLEAPVDAALGSITETGVTILDDDAAPVVGFSAPDYSAVEGDGTLAVTVTLSAPSGITATVDYTTAPNSATEADYQPVTGTLTFAPGETEQVVRVTVINDSLVEGDESFSLSLSNPANAFLDPLTQAVLTIVDDDSPSTPTPTATSTPLPTATTTPASSQTPGATSTPQPTPTMTATPAGSGRAFLPMVLRGPGQAGGKAPDLVVKSITVTSGDVIVVVQNQGTGPVVNPFWVDLYVSPNPAPVKVNDVWSDGRSAQGAVWGVSAADLAGLTPGGSITLTLSSGSLFTKLTTLSAIGAGVDVYAQADSASTLNPAYGAVLEVHEISGASYNNIAHIKAQTAFARPGGLVSQARIQSTDELPAR